jgi:hypothetical protein
VANLYGVANPVANGVSVAQATTLVCNAGVETTIMSATLAAPSAGFFYPAVWGTLFMSQSATPATAVSFGARIGAGADFATQPVPVYFLSANTNTMFSFFLVGAPSGTIWQGAGATINMTVNPTGFAVNCNQPGGQACFFLFRAADQ